MQQVVLDAQGQRRNLVVDLAALGGQIEDRAPPIGIGKFAIDAAVLDQFGHGTAHRDLVQHRAFGDFDGRQAGKAAKYCDDSPFGNRQSEPLVIGLCDRRTHRMRQDRQAIRQKLFKY